MRLKINLTYILVIILHSSVSNGVNLYPGPGDGFDNSQVELRHLNQSKSSNDSDDTDITAHAVNMTEDMTNNSVVESNEFHELIEHISSDVLLHADEMLQLTKIFKMAATRKAILQNDSNVELTMDTDQIIKLLTTQTKLVEVNATNRTDKETSNESYEKIPSTENKLVFRPKDCAELLIAGAQQDGEYTIYPFRCHCSSPVQVFCDMTTDGGGWTVILSRKAENPQEDFDRKWEDYAHGFGSPQGEYWMGNRHLHMLTSSETQILRIEATEPNIHGEWNDFTVASEEDLFEIHLSEPNPKNTINDAFKNLNSQRFSTFDQDSDNDNKHNCAAELHGGWWYNECSAQKSEKRQRIKPHRYNKNQYEEYDFIFNVLDEENFLPMTGNYTTSGNSSAYNGVATHPWSKYDNTRKYPSQVYLKIRPLLCSEQISKAYLNNPDMLCQTAIIPEPVK